MKWALGRRAGRPGPLPSPIVVGTSAHLGTRGVFATRTIAAGEVIERCPVVLIPVERQAALEETGLTRYHFAWTDTHHALAMGHGSIINHAYRANTSYERDIAGGVIVFRAVAPIRRGDEVTINYNGRPNDTAPLDERYGIPPDRGGPGTPDEPFIRRHFDLEPVACLGAGGFGTVWRVRSGSDDAALKLLEADAPKRRWQREVDAHRAVRSNRVPELLDAGEVEADGSVVRWLLQRFIDGPSVRMMMRERSWPAPADLARYRDEILQAVGDVHAAGLVFRDVSAGNIVLDAGAWDRPFLVDLGLAIPAAAPVRDLARRAGTHAYKAPEQLRGEPVTPATDLFGIGVVCYKLASGGLHPFLSAGERLSAAEAQARISAGPRPLPAEQASNEPWIRGLLAFDPADRVGTPPIQVP